MGIMLNIDCLDKPVMLFLTNGNVLEVNSFHNKNQIMTNFFLITQINNVKNCMTIMPLYTCSVCCDKFALVPTDQFMTFDKSDFCGYHFIPNSCIRKCNHPPIQIKDCICTPFIILPGYNESVLWQSNLIANQSGFINLYIEKGNEDHLELRIYNNNTSEHKTYPLIELKSYNFPVNNCSLIKVLRTSTKTKVKGLFEIELYSEIETQFLTG